MPTIIFTMLRVVVLILILSGIGFAAHKGALGGAFNQEWVNTYVRDTGQTGQVIYFGMAAVMVACGLPRQIISFLGGYAFGLSLGTCLALGATGVGCIVCFLIARFIGRDIITKRFPKSVQNADSFLSSNTLVITLLIRLFPLGNNFATNLTAGVSSARPLPFFFGSIIGYIPQTLIFTLLGSGISLEPKLRITLSLLLFMLSALLGIYLWRLYQKDKTLNKNLG